MSVVMCSLALPGGGCSTGFASAVSASSVLMLRMARVQIDCNAWVCEAHGSLQASRCLQPAARLPGSNIPTLAHLQHHLTDLCSFQRQELAGTGSDSRLTASLQAPKYPFQICHSP